MTHLILIRHGQSQANLERRFAGIYDAPLTALGERQAALSAAYVAKNYKISRVYASDLRRAYFTGKAAADACGVEIVPDRRLREISAGAWEGMLFDEIVEKYPEDFGLFMTDVGASRATDGESVAELAARVMDALHDLAEHHDGETVVIATHATPIRAAQSLVSYGDLAHMQSLKWVSNASVTDLVYDKGAFHFDLISHDEHLAGLVTKLPDTIE